MNPQIAEIGGFSNALLHVMNTTHRPTMNEISSSLSIGHVRYTRSGCEIPVPRRDKCNSSAACSSEQDVGLIREGCEYALRPSGSNKLSRFAQAVSPDVRDGSVRRLRCDPN